MEVTKWLKPSISVSRIGDSASVTKNPAAVLCSDDASATVDRLRSRVANLWRLSCSLPPMRPLWVQNDPVGHSGYRR
jgi:hypothetical protein